MEEVLRILAAQEEKMKHKRTERALAAGFASLEEYKQHQSEKERQEEIEKEQAIKQHCLATGKSREQYQREREEFLDEQIRRHPKPTEYSFLPPMNKCDCKEHAFPFFCAPSLVDYKSQHFPDMMEYISTIHHLNTEDIKIQDTDKSKRLEQEHWEQHMARKPDEATVDLPFWAKADGVTLQIMRQSGFQEASISPSPSPTQVPSLLSDDPASSSPSADNAATDSMDTTIEIEAADRLISLPCSHEIPLTKVCQSELPTIRAEKHIPKGRPGDFRKRRPSATTKAGKWCVSKDSRITKSFWKPAMGLRSRNIATFYRLGCDGKAADYQQ
ncbi:MAG: hypothetical protein Q9209_001536 [Squamulea sp. 1 TL-2023]